MDAHKVMSRAAVVVFLSLAITVFASAEAAQSDIFDIAEPYFEQVFGSKGGDSRIQTMAQDHDGLIWVGTEHGVYQFDGYEYNKADFYNSNGRPLPNAWITSIKFQSANIVWIGTFQEGLLRLDLPERRYSQFKHKPQNSNSLSSDRISDILIDDLNQSIWLATDNGLNHFNPSSGVFDRYFHSSPSISDNLLGDRTRVLHRDKSNNIWVGSWNGVHIFEPITGSFIPRYNASAGLSLSGYIIRTIHEDSLGNFWFGSYNNGLYRATSKTFLRRLETDDRINAITQVNDDEIWTSSLEMGIASYNINDGKLKNLYRHDPINPATPPADYSHTILLGRSGQVWIGTADFGVTRVNIKNGFSRMLVPSSIDNKHLSAKDVYSIVERDNGEIWIGTSGNGVDVFDPQKGRIRNYHAAENSHHGLSSNFIFSLIQTRDGTTWLGSSGQGLFKYIDESDSFEQYTLSDTEAANTVIHITEEADGNLLLSSGSSYGRFNVSKQLFTNIDFPNISDTKLVHFMAASNNSGVWVASFKQLMYLPPGANKLIQMPLPAEIAADASYRIKGLSSTANDKVLLVSDKFVFKIHNAGKAKPRYELLASHNLEIESLFEVPNGDYWGATAFYSHTQDKIIPLGKADGIHNRSQLLGSAVQTTSGTLIFGGNFGATVIRPENYQPWDFSPTIIVRDVHINGELHRGSLNHLHLQADVSVFSVKFAALDFRAPEELKYAYKLMGYDHDWVSSNAKDRTATYTNLPPGRYSLAVKATNHGGNWSEKQLTISITIMPSWYQTWWFRLLLLSLLVLSIYALIHLRLFQINNKRRLLLKLVKLRTKELETSLEKLQKTQGQLVSSQKNAALGRLVSGMAHELNTPVSVVKTGFSLIKEQTLDIVNGVYKEQEQSTQNIQQMNKALDRLESSSSLVDRNIEKMINLIASFKLVSADQNNPRPQRFMLMSYVEEIVIPLKDKLKAQDIEVFITGDKNLCINSYQGSFRQVITELIENAIKHAFQARPLEAPDELTLKRSNSKFIEINIKTKSTSELADTQPKRHVSRMYAGDQLENLDGQIIEVQVRDNGIGMEESFISTIFDPFVAGEAANVGLGMHIVYNIVCIQMHGNVVCKSTPETGSCFSVDIPSV